jgi:hypothetical protein
VRLNEKDERKKHDGLGKGREEEENGEDDLVVISGFEVSGI